MILNFLANTGSTQQSDQGPGSESALFVIPSATILYVKTIFFKFKDNYSDIFGCPIFSDFYCILEL